LASACISVTVGPSGTGSVLSYHLTDCSAQKYGPLKISCRQTICAPSAPPANQAQVLLDHGLLLNRQRLGGGTAFEA
jgi:hypothetical protein